MPHIHEKIDLTVETFIVHKDKVLLRRHDKYGIWLSIGGHVELDEDPNQAAVREAKEEVGLDIELLDERLIKTESGDFRELISPVALNRHRISPTHEHVCMIYFASAKSEKVIPEKPTDVWKWCSEKDIDSLEGVSDNVAFYAKRALLTLGSHHL
jgi:8-oxo-dGTP pyrophosphatase MutT (NUDIX family)